MICSEATNAFGVHTEMTPQSLVRRFLLWGLADEVEGGTRWVRYFVASPRCTGREGGLNERQLRH